MKMAILIMMLLPVLVICFATATEAQTKPEAVTAAQTTPPPALITLRPGEPAEISYDAGTARFLASSSSTNGAWSLVELKEMPGYHTNLHRHIYTDEAFYVLEGVLTVRIRDTTAEYAAGSYVLIPHGTPHGQGNTGTIPVRILLTMTPGGFEKSFADRAELFKTVKPTDPDFRKKRQENAVAGHYDVEFLKEWKP